MIKIGFLSYDEPDKEAVREKIRNISRDFGPFREADAGTLSPESRSDYWEAYRMAYDYNAYFCKQKTDCMNFYIVLSSALITAQVAIFKEGFSFLSIAFPLVIMVLSFIFRKMEQRTGTFLIYYGELLRYYEEIGRRFSFSALFAVETEARKENADRKNPCKRNYPIRTLNWWVYVLFTIISVSIFVIAILTKSAA